MTAAASRISRIRQSESGDWFRQQEDFPGLAGRPAGFWSGVCSQQVAPPPKEKTHNDAGAISQADFAKHVRDLLGEVTVEWERRWQLQKSKAAYDVLSKLIGETTRLFGENVRIYESRDPEFPDDANIVFRVEAPLGSSEALRAEREWAKAVYKIAPKAGMFNLVIYRKQ